MTQSVSFKLSPRKIDFYYMLGDMTFVVEKSDTETRFTLLDLTHFNTQTPGRTPLDE